MGGFFRMEVKVVKRKSIRGNGSFGENSALKASAYISAEKVRNTPVKASAYISGQKLHKGDETVIVDYTRKKGVVYSAVVLPENAPKRLQDPEVLWNEVENLESKRNDSVLYREWICCFEKHLSMAAKTEIAQTYAEMLASEGMAVQYAIHLGHDGNNNDHVHYMGTVRGFDNGEWKTRRVKPQKYQLDDNGNRIPVIDKNTGVQKRLADGTRCWKKTKVEYEDAFNEMHVGNVERWRKSFAELENKYLADEYKVSAESYAKQGIDKIPGQHVGKASSNIQRKLQEQVDGLAEERTEYLERILEQVQRDYHNASKVLVNEKGKLIVPESQEHKELRREIRQQMLKVSKYKPTRKYVTDMLGRGHLQIEKALCDLVHFYRRQIASSENDAYVNIEVYQRLADMVVKAEDMLMITFSHGATKTIENFIVQSEYDVQKTLQQQLSEEIRITENEIFLLKGKEVNEKSVERNDSKFSDYENRNRTIIESAERITDTAKELRASTNRLAELRRRSAKTVERMSEAEDERKFFVKQSKKVGARKF